MNPDSILTSTFYDKRWSTNNLMRVYQLEYEDGTLEERIDYSDWRFTSMLKRLRTFSTYRYNSAEKFTTLVHRIYGNTTVYRVILAFNGFMHPYEIERGTLVKLPDPADLASEIQKLLNKKQVTRSIAI